MSGAREPSLRIYKMEKRKKMRGNFEVIRSEYGKEMAAFEFDYLGGHKKFEGILLNAGVKLYENGLLIKSGLSNNYAYLKWGDIICINYLLGNRERFEIEYSKGAITLEKAKGSTNMEEFIKCVSELSPDVEIKRKEDRTDSDSYCDISEERLMEFDEQDKRIKRILEGIDEEDDIKAMETWTKYLKVNLQFPFEAEISECQEEGPLKAGYKLQVKGIEDFDDLYGVIVEATYKNRKYSFPLGDLEATDKQSVNYVPIDDYCVWFANR